MQQVSDLRLQNNAKHIQFLFVATNYINIDTADTEANQATSLKTTIV